MASLGERDWDWEERAACREFPINGTTHENESLWFPKDIDFIPKKARETCERCPVRDECLEAAMVAEGDMVAASRYGIRAGLSPAQRAELAVARAGGLGEDYSVECECGCGRSFDPRLTYTGRIARLSRRGSRRYFSADCQWRVPGYKPPALKDDAVPISSQT